jgi:hypothetical protein
MRLLNTTTKRLETFVGDSIPHYAILSHTWEAEEVLFEDVRDESNPLPTGKAGWAKVDKTCQRAMADGFAYVWIDTCCIDKSSSAELSEAINSMFTWYQNSGVCYAYLCDVRPSPGPKAPEHGLPPYDFIRKSRWFTRGWTLQELIAPANVRLYDADWNFIAALSDSEAVTDVIADRTRIPRAVLHRDFAKGYVASNPGPTGFVIFPMPCPEHNTAEWRCIGCKTTESLPDVLEAYSIAERMSWAAGRETTRPEDRAYSLLGIFGINMPLLYGEGSRAFARLQEEIIRTSDDQSILASRTAGMIRSFFAHSPDCFAGTEIIKPPWGMRWLEEERNGAAITATSKAIEMSMLVCPCKDTSGDEAFGLGILACSYASDSLCRPAILLDPMNSAPSSYQRLEGGTVIKISPLSPKGQITLGDHGKWRCRLSSVLYSLALPRCRTDMAS